MPDPPETYKAFQHRYPKIGQAWEMIAAAGHEGPLDDKTVRLLKLAVALGAMREGAVHANVRKALATGISREEIEQIVAVAAGTLGLPSTVAIFSWVQDVLDRLDQRRPDTFIAEEAQRLSGEGTAVGRPGLDCIE
jgi:alkylhydroperoxidase/carboxymuconolactone decarboxylase family protein YurZ